jgi:SAM-dependent methyltransferase
MVGLASGSWAQVVANHPQVEKMTVVEINPGYLRLIPQYPAVASLLTNSKVNIVIDDGRRWLVSNPAASFDVIVMNTTYNWRAQITDLLSVEFLQLARKHLKPGGVLFYNTTSSEEVQRTGASVFPYALMVGNCLAVSDSPIAMDWERWKAVLKQYRIDGQLVFDFDQPDSRKKFEELTSIPVNQPERFDSVQDADLIRARTKGARTITDDNMGTEWPASQFLR